MLGKEGWPYFVRYEPRGWPITYIVLKEDKTKEDQPDDHARDHLYVSNEEVDEVEDENDDVLGDDHLIDGDIVVDVDVDMGNSFTNL